jgi:hypothetical protein
MRKYNYKQLSKLTELTIKLYNTTDYLRITDNTHAANGMHRGSNNEKYSQASIFETNGWRPQWK